MEKNKVVVITGAAMGIGKGIAKELRKDFNHIVIADRAEKEGKETAWELETEDCTVEFYPVDLLEDTAIEKMFYAVYEKYGKIDGLVCNAGIQIRHWAMEFPLDEFDRVLDLNLRAYYVCACAAARYMKKEGKGAIVCISSVNSSQYHSKRSAYNISKAAINGLVGTLGIEWGRYCIRINGVAPGYVETEVMLSGIRDGVIDTKQALSMIPMKRFIRIEEIGSVVRFLLSEDASAVTGQILYADGGWSKAALPEEKEME